MSKVKKANTKKSNGTTKAKVAKIATPVKKTPSRISVMRDLMQKDYYPADFLAQKSGVSKITVSVQASSHLPNQGWNVFKKRSEGRVLYHIKKRKDGKQGEVTMEPKKEGK